eukprot:m.37892 g.37892  ORF g.37892 m.37892 type:complete len:657 (+) comp6767_c0_seq1:235-2205(+)
MSLPLLFTVETLTSTTLVVLGVTFFIGLVIGSIATRIKKLLNKRSTTATIERANWELFLSIVRDGERTDDHMFDREIVHLIRSTKLDVVKLYGSSLGHCGSTVLHELAASLRSSVMLLSAIVTVAKCQHPTMSLHDIVNLKNGKGTSVLQDCCYSGVYENIVWLEEQGADVTYINPHQRSVLHEVLSSPRTTDQVHIINYLLSRCDLLANEKIAASAFHSAVFNSRDEVVEVLMKHCPAEYLSRETDESGDTLLHIAIKERRTHLCRMLVNAGANVSAQNAKGISAVETAYVTAQPAIATFMLWIGSSFDKELSSSIFRRTIACGMKYTRVGWTNVPVPPETIYMRNIAITQMAELGARMTLNCLSFEKSMQAYPCTTLFLTISLGGLGPDEHEKLQKYFTTIQVIAAKALMGASYTEDLLEQMWNRDAFSRPPFSNVHASLEYRAALALLDILEPYRPLEYRSTPSLQHLCHMSFRRAVLKAIDTSDTPARELEKHFLVYKLEGVAANHMQHPFTEDIDGHDDSNNFSDHVTCYDSDEPGSIEDDCKNQNQECREQQSHQCVHLGDSDAFVCCSLEKVVHVDDLDTISLLKMISDGSLGATDSFGGNLFSLTNGFPTQIRNGILLDSQDIWGVYTQKSRKVVREQQRICLLGRNE